MTKLNMTVLYEMMEARGFSSDMTECDEYIIGVRERANTPKFTQLVFRNVYTTISTKELRRINANISEIEEKTGTKINSVILFYVKAPQKQLKAVAEGIETLSGIRIEFMESALLNFNPTKHVLVPKHEIASEEESKAVNKHEQPSLLSTDPIVRFYAYEKGELIRVTRKSGYISYRVVR